MSAITYELSHAENSLLKLDAQQTQENREEYIYLASLDDWVKQKYNFSIYPDSNLNVINPDIESLKFESSRIVETAVGDDIEHDYLIRTKTVSAIQEWVKSNKKGGYSDIETNHLLITFFSAMLGVAQYKGNIPPQNLRELKERINVAGTAEKLANRMNSEFGEVKSQSIESIKSRIEDARKAAINNLRP